MMWPSTTTAAVARPAATCCPTKLSRVESGAIWESCPARSPTTSMAAAHNRAHAPYRSALREDNSLVMMKAPPGTLLWRSRNVWHSCMLIQYRSSQAWLGTLQL